MLTPFRARVARLGDLLIFLAVVAVLFGPIIYSYGRYRSGRGDQRAEGVRPDPYQAPSVAANQRGRLCGAGTPADPFRVCEPRHSMTISEATAWAAELTGHMMECWGDGAYQCRPVERFEQEIVVYCREGRCAWASNPALERVGE